jgi:hypothetical protein
MLTVQPATGQKHELVSYAGRAGNASCAICGTVSTAAAPDFLRRERKGWIWNLMLSLARKRYHQKEGGKTCMGHAEDQATKLVKLPDRIAAIVGKTYAVMGDGFELNDDQALMMIRDRLDELDETLIARNKDKRLIRR